jgi:hypothetical protein
VKSHPNLERYDGWQAERFLGICGGMNTGHECGHGDAVLGRVSIKDVAGRVSPFEETI